MKLHPLARLSAALAAGLLCIAAHAAPKIEDTIAQRVQACTGCHGPQGRAAADGYYPRLAGKPVEYLYHQLLSFRDGRRQYALMANLLAPLSDAYLHEIAEYFSGLDVPYPPPQAATGSVDELTRGETLVTKGDPALKIPACVQCHGAALMGVAPAIPALLGLPRDYVNGQLGAWRTGNRHALAPDCMGEIAQRLRPEDIASVSQWLAGQRASGHAAASLPEALPMACGGVTAQIDAKP